MARLGVVKLLLGCVLTFAIPAISLAQSQGSGEASSEDELINHETTIESSIVTLVQGSDGEIVNVITSNCQTCPEKHHLPAPGMKVMSAKADLPAKRYSDFSGEAATVFLDIDTRMVNRVRFFEVNGGSSNEN